MKTKVVLAHALCGVCVLAAQRVGAEATVPGNFGGVGDYSGWNGNTAIPLEVRHNGNDHIQWFTDSIQRMQLYKTQTTWQIQDFNNIKQNGYLAISDQPLFFSQTVGPFSRLHLVDSCDNNPVHYAQQFGFRPWMKNGITFTGNQDQSYVGQKYSGTTSANDSTDMVIQWSDNDDESPWPTDRLRFLFTDDYDNTNQPETGAQSMEGLESFRIYIPNDSEAFVGVGDWWKATVANGYSMVDPAERFDVLDGRVRIRQLPTEAPMDTVEKVVVVNEDGVLGWLDMDDLPSSGADCDWEWDDTNEVIATAYNGGPSCTDEDWTVAIGISPGTASNVAKLQVVQFLDTASGQAIKADLHMNEGTSNSGVFAHVRPQAGFNGAEDAIGLRATVEDGGENTYGVLTRSSISSGTTNSEVFGTDALATINGQATTAYGLRGQAEGLGTVTRAYGVYGSCEGSTTAGWKYGVRGFIPSTASTASTASYGIHGMANNASLRYAVYGQAGGTDDTKDAYGVYGNAVKGKKRFGVYGTVTDQDTDTSYTANHWAGYFLGKVRITGKAYVNGNIWVTSDADLKTNVEDLQNATDLIGLLEPKQYEMRTADFPHLGLANGQQFGLIAQDVQQVLPQLVSASTTAAVIDSMGNEIHPDVQHLSINYMGLIPLLLSGAKEQQAVIEDLQTALADQAQRLDQLEQDLAYCCTNPEGTLDGRGMQQDGTGSGSHLEQGMSKSDDRLSIVPNPFQERTTLSYLLDAPAVVQLQVSTEQGLHLATLRNQQHDAGAY
ncbi:MAG: tail fiber domain-containing protein, partial [Flavobacteriales bacterium]|nr:tail fiber domain-containing protein [Flavobacteriales bacterium]